MSDPENTWRKRAAQVARRVNTGWFFQKISPVLIAGGFLFALTVLCIRTFLPEQFLPATLGIGGGALFAIAVAGAFLRARKHFIDRDAGLIRLEDRLFLNNSLTTASRGVGEWPDLKIDEELTGKAGLKWNIPALVLPLFSALALVLASFFVPIPNLEAKTKTLPPNEPGAWQQMEEWLTALEEEDLIDDTSLEEAREKIDELRNQPEDEWFSHSSMEATDSMRDALGRDLQEAGQELATLERDLAALQNFAGNMSEEAREMLMKEYDEALKNLGLNNMKLNQDLMKQLKNMDLSQLSEAQMNQLSKEQLQKLREQLKNG
ncbi:MAG: hypothetical protein P1V20_19495, partial [Verrucomicrobiales bacterium]|nr:hypothetical protein [Verrucomicrobiales bacterium]